MDLRIFIIFSEYVATVVSMIVDIFSKQTPTTVQQTIASQQYAVSFLTLLSIFHYIVKTLVNHKPPSYKICLKLISKAHEIIWSIIYHLTENRVLMILICTVFPGTH